MFQKFQIKENNMEENLFNLYSFPNDSTLLEIQPYIEVTTRFLNIKTQIDTISGELNIRIRF